jgi:succinate dehydrogenase / fumarate reductase flavoprotein subunit
MDPKWRGVNLVCTLGPDGAVTLRRQPVPEIRQDLLELFDSGELKKYLTEEELSRLGPAEQGSEGR